MLRGVPASPEVGGEYGIVRGHYPATVVHDDFTLVPGIDRIYQNPLLYPDDKNIVITLDTANAKAGDRFVIKSDMNGNGDHYLEVKQGAATIDKIYARVVKEFIFDGTNWIGASIGTVQTDITCGIGIGKNARCDNAGVAIGHYTDAHDEGVAIGTSGLGYDYGVAIGFQSQGHTNGVAIGYQALGHTYGIGVGYQADGANYGVAFGYKADSGDQYSIALGYISKCTRYAELAINIDAQTDQENQMMIAGWAGETSNNTPAEIFCGGAANQRFTIRPQSALTFKIIVAARDNTADECADYMFEGLIKRDGAGNTVLSTVTKTVKYEGDAAWDCNVTADDGNEALIITATGDADNTVQWAARLDGVETHF